MKIAIDGPAASGKGTLARTLAMKLSFDYLDTGTLYRAVAREAIGKNLELSEENQSIQQLVEICNQLELPISQDETLRNSDVAQAASKIASLADVRSALVEKQREFAQNPPSGKGAVLDGRDIGTIILPDADRKFYIDANIVVRAKRRHLELEASGTEISNAEVLADLTERDAREKNRTTAPMIAADDAIFIDTTQKNAEEVLQLTLSFIER